MSSLLRRITIPYYTPHTWGFFGHSDSVLYGLESFILIYTRHCMGSTTDIMHASRLHGAELHIVHAYIADLCSAITNIKASLTIFNAQCYCEYVHSMAIARQLLPNYIISTFNNYCVWRDTSCFVLPLDRVRCYFKMIWLPSDWWLWNCWAWFAAIIYYRQNECQSFDIAIVVCLDGRR